MEKMRHYLTAARVPRALLALVLLNWLIVLQLTSPLLCVAQNANWFQMGLREFRQGNFAVAIVHFKRALASDPEQTRVMLMLARSLRDNGQPADAKSYYQRVLALDPKNFDAIVELADILSWKEETQPKAINLLQTAATLKPQASEVKRKIAIIESWHERTRKQAIQDLKTYCEEHPADTEALLLLARCLSWSHLAREAEKYFALYLQIRPGDQKAKHEAEQNALTLAANVNGAAPAKSTAAAKPVEPFRSALTNLEKGYYIAAIKDLRQAIKEPLHKREATLLLAKALEKNGETDEAASVYKQVIADDPANLAAKKELAEILSWRQSTRGEAIKILASLAEQTPSDLELKRKLGILASWEATTKALAIHNLAAVIDARPDDSAVNLILAHLFDTPQSADRAEGFYRQYLKLKPDDQKARLDLAMLLSYKPETRRLALPELAIVLAAQPDNKLARLTYGKALFWLQDYARALPELEKLTLLYPNDLELSIAYASSLCEVGREDQANERYASILSNPPQDKEQYAQFLDAYGQCLLKQDRLADALRISQKLLSDDSISKMTQVDALLRIGEINRRLLQWPSTEDAARTALALQPDNSDARIMLAGSLLAQSKTKEAETVLNDLRLTARSGDTYSRMMAQLDMAKGNWLDASVVFSRLLDEHPDDIDLASSLSDCFLHLKDYQKAQQVAKAALTRHPESARLRFTVAKCLAYSGDEQEAVRSIADMVYLPGVSATENVRLAQEASGSDVLRPLSVALLRQLLSKDPENKSADLLLAHILSWSQPGRSESIKRFEEYLSKNENDDDIRKDLAEVLSWNNQRRESLRLYASLIEKKPQDKQLKLGQAKVLSWNGNLTKALRLYGEVLAQEPNCRDALLGTAQCQEWGGDHLKAEKTLNRTATLYADDADVVLERALNFRQMGRYDKAAKMLSQFWGLYSPLATSAPGALTR